MIHFINLYLLHTSSESTIFIVTSPEIFQSMFFQLIWQLFNTRLKIPSRVLLPSFYRGFWKFNLNDYLHETFTILYLKEVRQNKHPLNIISKYRFAQAQCKCDRIPEEEYPHKYNIDFGFSSNKHECHGQCHYNCQAT